MPVAERLYYADSHQRSFSARVTDIREYARTDGRSQWQIALDRTAFYPTGGGQPFDRGTLAATARSGAELVAEIDDVIEDDDGEIWHSTRKPLLAGTEVTGAIDWGRRLDHMQQHSGQHLLSAVFAQELGARTVSFHLGDAVSTIDLAAETPEEQAAILNRFVQIEQMVNRRIAENLPVSVRVVAAEQAQALLAAGLLRKLPPRAGPIRLVEMPGIDLNACGGTHVRALGEIGSLLLRGSSRVKQGLRVEFVCGLRAVSAARADFATLSSAAAMLSVQREGVPTAVERLLAETRAAARSQQKLREELACCHAAQLAAEAPVEAGMRLVRHSFADRDAEYIKLLAAQLVAAEPAICGSGAAVRVGSEPATVAILIATQNEPNRNEPRQNEPAVLVLAVSRSLALDCGRLLREALAPLGLRGGGSPSMAQTMLPRAQAEQIAAALAATLRSAAAAS